MRRKALILGVGVFVVMGCKTNRGGASATDPVSEGPSRVPVKDSAPVIPKDAAVSESTLPSVPQPTTPPAAPVVPPLPPTVPSVPSVPSAPINPASTASGNTTWFGSEMRTKNSFGSMGKPLKVSWQVKPARGNCVITLLSLFNGDRIFSTNKGSWSEITFEIFGGANGSSSDFQTQYITRGSPDDRATTRGKDHSRHHTRGADLANIFDDRFHLFQIEWTPSSGESSSLVYRLDGGSWVRERLAP
ncbi:MAG: glycosyl hydrolase family protein [Proteobacteria bacterium]|nr:MAG: glycosyl hydrolase family protein [Pseudomonadota bacterium]